MSKAVKNLFDYATKELSQDAFLRWLFENYSCDNENIVKVCTKLINEFTQLSININDVEKLETRTQEKHIDVIVDFYLKDKRRFIIAIEDKTYSNEHNQLSTYNSHLKKEYEDSNKANCVYKIFFKTDILNESDKKACEENGWKYYTINDIYKLFYMVKNTGSEVLDQYAEHVCKLYEICSDYPKDKSLNEWNSLDFRTFLDKEILPKNFDIEKIRGTLWWSWQGQYNSIAVWYDFIIKGRNKISFTLEVLPRPGYKCLIIVRASIFPGNFEKETSIPLDGEYSELKNKLRDRFVNSHGNLFKRRYKKICIACASDSIAKRLEYTNSVEDFKCAINEVVDAFISFCDEETREKYYLNDITCENFGE